MIIVLHTNYRVVQIIDANKRTILHEFVGKNITQVIMDVSSISSEDYIVWCHTNFKFNLNYDAIKNIFHHNRVFASFNPCENDYLPKEIGYVERSYYLKLKKNVTFPTWLMSSCVGGVHASVIQNLRKELQPNNNFDFFLSSLAKRAMVEGLFCYSEPKLLTENKKNECAINQASIYTLFKFVKQHYKWVWVFFLAFSYFIYQRRIMVLPLIRSLFYRKLSTNFDLEKIKIKSSRQVINNREIDVIIPTIGRKKYLYDVLKDLSKQTLLPQNVIIVEQNAKPNSISDLDYLATETWPFQIKYKFINQTGVCNARNLALSEVESEWTFLGDDDNRFDAKLLESMFNEVEKLGTKVGTTVYLQQDEIQTYLKTAQTSIFGAGNSLVKSSLLSKVSFDKRYEFNYGEDTDFGMQLRHLGEDVIYFANIKITHLKAPIGGYRTKVNQLWDNDIVKPKPSPTIYFLYNKYFTTQQLQGYKLLLAIRLFRSNRFKNPFSFVKQFKKQWNRSQFWSIELTKNSDA